MDLDGLLESSQMLCSCFIVFEATITQISQPYNICILIYIWSYSIVAISDLSEEDLLRLHTSLTEALRWVLVALNQLEGCPVESTPLLLPCVRVLGAWLAEDSLSLSTEVYAILPSLLHLAKLTDTSEAEAGGCDLLKFLLPGLSHLSADDKPRRILMNAGLWELLKTHLQRLLSENVL